MLDIDEYEFGMNGYQSTLKGGELNHKIILYTEPFHEMEEYPKQWNTWHSCMEELRRDPEDKANNTINNIYPHMEAMGKVSFTGLEWIEKRKAAKTCEVCGKVLEKRNKHADHNHDTGKLRGVLCAGCNMTLGTIEKLKRNPYLATKFEEYLKKYV
jgi:hypothetical protein